MIEKILDTGDGTFVAVGDHAKKAEAEVVAALNAVYQLENMGLASSVYYG